MMSSFKTVGYMYPYDNGTIYESLDEALMAFKRDLEANPVLNQFGPFTESRISINDSEHAVYHANLRARISNRSHPIQDSLEEDHQNHNLAIKCDTLPSYDSARKSGKIVMNPYSLVKKEEVFKWGVKGLTIGRGTVSTYSYVYGWLEWKKPRDYGWFNAQVRSIAIHQGSYDLYGPAVIPHLGPSNVLPESYYASDLVIPVSTALLAKAANADFDAATNVAEARETIQTLKTLLPDLVLTIRKLKRQWLDIPAQLRARTRANRRQRRNAWRSRHALAETGSAASKYWLTYRYGFLPLKASVEDAIKALKRSNAKYITERTGDSMNLNQLYQSHETSLPCDFQVSYSNKTTGVWKARGVQMEFKRAQFWIPTAAWELVPFSFVVDWFLNVGDLIGGLRPVPAEETNACISTLEKVKIDGYTLFSQAAKVTPITEQIDYHSIIAWEEEMFGLSLKSVCYQAEIVRFKRGQPQRGLSIQNGLNFIRSLDLLAISWQRSGRKIINH